VIRPDLRHYYRFDEAWLRQRDCRNGSVLIHDAEIAMVGSTSEDVDATLGEGIFGGAKKQENLSTMQRATEHAIRLALVKH